MDFESVEEKIKLMAIEVKALNDKSEILSSLNDDIQTNDCFTPSEKESVKEKLNNYQIEQTRKVNNFRRNLDIYHNHVVRLKQIIDTRESVLSKIREDKIENMSEIIGVFESQDLALSEEFQKYLHQIE